MRRTGVRINMNIKVQALIKFLSGLIMVILLIFVPAGTLHYINGCILTGILFIPMLIMGIIMSVKNPELLEKRLNAKEKDSGQKNIIRFSGIIFLAGFIVAGLNYRFKWLIVPQWTVIISSIVFLLSYAMYAEVLRENTYLSRTVEIQENQKIIDTGLYGIIRHPMYTATIFMFLSIPLVLGSVHSFVIFLLYPVIIVMRLSNEEKFLENNLDGYSQYKDKVKYRLIPFIW